MEISNAGGSQLVTELITQIYVLNRDFDFTFNLIENQTKQQMKYDSNLTVLVCFFCLVGLRIQAQDMGLKTLAQGLTFHASFDGQVDADYAQGDSKFYTAESYKMADQATPGLNHPDVKLSSGKGRYGDALEFQKKNSKALFFKGPGNVEYSDANWSGTVSFWLSLDPAKDLEPGYCDPIQVTDSDWNDAALWVDFNKEPRARISAKTSGWAVTTSVLVPASASTSTGRVRRSSVGRAS